MKERIEKLIQGLKIYSWAGYATLPCFGIGLLFSLLAHTAEVEHGTINCVGENDNEIYNGRFVDMHSFSNEEVHFENANGRSIHIVNATCVRYDSEE